MKKTKFAVSIGLIFFAVIFTIMVKVIDVKPTGVNNTEIGFSTLNHLVFNATGVNIVWYYITDWLGLIPIFMAIIYAIIGVAQLIKRKSFCKVDKEILALGIFYIILIALYILFEKVIINYRPVLMDGYLEASYPSSHTLMAVCICGSSIIVNNKLYKNKLSKFSNALSVIIIITTVLGRLISGVHWFTDILGGIIISLALLVNFNFAIQKLYNSKNK